MQPPPADGWLGGGLEYLVAGDCEGARAARRKRWRAERDTAFGLSNMPSCSRW